MPKAPEPKKRNLAILIVLLLCFAGIIILAGRGSSAAHASVTRLTDHWRVIVRGEYLEDMSLSEVNLSPVKKGDTFLMSHVLPGEEVTGACVQVKTVHATIRVYVGETVIYEDGAQYTAAHRMTPSHYHYIPLPEGYGGKTLTIHLTANEDGAFSGIDPVRLGNVQALSLSYLHAGRLTLLVGIFLMVLGLVLVFSHFFLWLFYRTERRILYSGLLSLLLGLYILCYNKLPQFINSAVVPDNVLEYATLFLLPSVVTAFLGSIRDEKKRKPYRIMALFDLGIAVLILVLHAANLLHINNCVPFIHMLILAESFLLIAMTVHEKLQERKRGEDRHPWQVSEQILMCGFFILVLMVMIDIGRYSYMRYFGAGGDAYANLNFITAGAFFFAISLILNFFYYHIERVYDEDIRERLTGLAFTDPLTGMANRSRCEQMLERFDKESFPCTVISIDVDRLKLINEHFGHAAGDRYLADTAEIINRCFMDAVLLGRMGGDEFIAVMSGTSKIKTDHSIDMLQEQLAEKNNDRSLTPFVMSYGVVSTDEDGIVTVRDALREADRRMFAMKEAHRVAKKEKEEKEGRADA
ncbi:MAG: GGDEF domain-containing protein [Lachnospiraceae bacterium]|nr:GGDEF domain-containing protein [Lachnospiraceae bacterium]